MMLALIAGVISEVSMPSLVAAAVLNCGCELTVALADLSTGEEWVCGRSLQEEDTGA